MSIKFDKPFFLGLFSREESNLSLFLSPIISSLVLIGTLILLTLIPFGKVIPNDILNMCIMFFGAIVAVFSMADRYFFLTKHLLKFNPFKDDPNEDKKLKFIITTPVYFGFTVFFFFTMIANSALGFGVTKTSASPILTCALLVVAFFFVLAMFKFETLESIEKVKKVSNQKINDVDVDLIH